MTSDSGAEILVECGRDYTLYCSVARCELCVECDMFTRYCYYS